jgi:hypothetical protein
MAKRRADICSAFSSTTALIENQAKHLNRSKRVSISDFSFNFNGLSESDCLSFFRFRKGDALIMMTAIAWPEDICARKRNRYSVTPFLTACVVLRRLATPCRWSDLEILFGKHVSQLFELFWECIEHFLSRRAHLVTGCCDLALLIWLTVPFGLFSD